MVFEANDLIRVRETVDKVVAGRTNTSEADQGPVQNQIPDNPISVSSLNNSRQVAETAGGAPTGRSAKQIGQSATNCKELKVDSRNADLQTK